MRWIVGIDEVGRGALAGPVVVAAAALPAGFGLRSRRLGKLKDSKKLTAKRREAWAECIAADRRIIYALARVYPRQIEKQNISRAANTAAARAYGKLGFRAGISPRKTAIFLDGGLFLGNGEPPRNARTVIKGDERIAAVQIASIVAKVHRDRLMRRLARRFPEYGFAAHKGYGTRTHLRALQKHGPTRAHRLTFMGKSAIMKKQ